MELSSVHAALVEQQWSFWLLKNRHWPRKVYVPVPTPAEPHAPWAGMLAGRTSPSRPQVSLCSGMCVVIHWREKCVHDLP